MHHAGEVKSKEEKPLEKRVFDLECQVSMQGEFIDQLVEQLNDLGIKVSTKLIT